MRPVILFALLLIPGSIMAQRQLRPYVGLHGSGDAQMYYLGPSVQFGADYRFFTRFGLTTYVHYFRRRIDRTYGNFEFEKGKFDCLTGALLLQAYLGRKPARGMFLGFGGAVQYLNNDFTSDWTSFQARRLNLLPAFRVGYAFPLGEHQITAELNATGPYHEGDQYSGSTELITQLSFGTRFVW